MRGENKLCPSTGKTGYTTFSDALKSLRGMVKDQAYVRETGKRLGIYRCICGEYHIGNTAKKFGRQDQDTSSDIFEWDE